MNDPLFLGLTRPSMIMGVTFEGLIFAVIISTLVFLASGNILYLLVFIPIHAINYLVCLKDPQYFQLMYLYSKTALFNRNKRFWKAASYTPLSFKKD